MRQLKGRTVCASTCPAKTKSWTSFPCRNRPAGAHVYFVAGAFSLSQERCSTYQENRQKTSFFHVLCTPVRYLPTPPQLHLTPSILQVHCLSSFQPSFDTSFPGRASSWPHRNRRPLRHPGASCLRLLPRSSPPRRGTSSAKLAQRRSGNRVCCLGDSCLASAWIFRPVRMGASYGVCAHWECCGYGGSAFADARQVCGEEKLLFLIDCCFLIGFSIHFAP